MFYLYRMCKLLSRAVSVGALATLAVVAFGLRAPSAQPASEPGGPAAPAGGAAQSTGALHGDVDCSGGVDAVDALMVLRWVAALSVSQHDPCAPVGTGTPYLQGDVDCSGGVDAVDALKILRYVAGLTVAQAGNCPLIGTTPATPTPTPSPSATPTPAPTTSTPTPIPTLTPTPTPSPAVTPTPTPTPTTTPTPVPTFTPTPTVTPTPTPSAAPTFTPTPTPTPPATPSPAPSQTTAPTPGPGGWLGCAYAAHWSGGDRTARVCVDAGEAQAEALQEGASCDPDPVHGVIADWYFTEVPQGGWPITLRLDMWAGAGTIACVKASNNIVTYEIALTATEASYYIDLPPIRGAGTFTVWVEFRGVMAAGRYGWLDFAALQSPAPASTPTPVL